MSPPPPLILDEMLGRLARYLRILGWDVEYARGVEDSEILERLRRDPDRQLVTRDRALARRAGDRAVLLASTALPEQLRTLRRAFPGANWSPTFARCTLCNGRLCAVGPDPEGRARGPEAPEFRCAACGQAYWEGSHTARVRTDVARWLGGESR